MATNPSTLVITLQEQDLQTLIIDCVNSCLKHQASKAQTDGPANDLMIATEAAEWLKLSVYTLYSKVHKGEIPVSKKGKRLYFSKEELTKWINSGKRYTTEELSENAHQSLVRRQGGGVK